MVIIVLIIIATCIICRCRLPVYIDSVCSCITALRLAIYLNCIISDSKRIASCAWNTTVSWNCICRNSHWAYSIWNNCWIACCRSIEGRCECYTAYRKRLQIVIGITSFIEAHCWRWHIVVYRYFKYKSLILVWISFSQTLSLSKSRCGIAHVLMEIQRACIYYIKLLKIQCILTLIYIIAAHLYSSAAYGLYSCIPALLLGKRQTIFINLILRVSGCIKIKIIIISFVSGICTRNKRTRSLLSLLLL